MHLGQEPCASRCTDRVVSWRLSAHASVTARPPGKVPPRSALGACWAVHRCRPARQRGIHPRGRCPDGAAGVEANAVVVGGVARSLQTEYDPDAVAAYFFRRPPHLLAFRMLQVGTEVCGASRPPREGSILGAHEGTQVRGLTRCGRLSCPQSCPRRACRTAPMRLRLLVLGFSSALAFPLRHVAAHHWGHHSHSPGRGRRVPLRERADLCESGARARKGSRPRCCGWDPLLSKVWLLWEREGSAAGVL